MTCRVFIIEHRGKKLLVLYIYNDRIHVPEEPARLRCLQHQEKSTVILEFLTGRALTFDIVEKCTDVMSADEIYVEVHRRDKTLRFRSSYRIGNVWYLDYIGLA